MFHLFENLVRPKTMIQSANSHERVVGMQELQHLRAPGYFAPLADWLADSDHHVRDVALMNLPNIDPERAVPLLLPFLLAPDTATRYCALTALAYAAPHPAVVALSSSLLHDSDNDRCCFAIDAVGRFGISTDARLIEHFVQASTPALRAATAVALCRLRIPDVGVAPIVPLLHDTSCLVRGVVCDCLNGYGSMAHVTLLDHVFRVDPDQHVRQKAGQAIFAIETRATSRGA